MKRALAVLALVMASVVSSAPAMAQGRLLDFGKATAGVIVFGALACTATRALLSSGLPLCTQTQRQQGVPFDGLRHGHLLTPQVRERLIVIERTTPRPVPDCTVAPVVSSTPVHVDGTACITNSTTPRHRGVWMTVGGVQGCVW